MACVRECRCVKGEGRGVGEIIKNNNNNNTGGRKGGVRG